MTFGGIRIPVMSKWQSYAVGVTLAASLLAATSASATRETEAACSPSTTILASPRLHSLEVQAKGINDRGDVVGFADSDNSNGPIHAILWKGGKAAGAVDLGLLPGYVASEAYGVNDRRVVFGLLYDKKERAVPFRWANGRMAILKGPNGELLRTDNPGAGGRNAINSSGEMAWTVIVRGDRRAVRWTPDGKASFLPGLPGHAWTDAFGINDDGVVSGWSRKLPNDDGAENPVLWTRSGNVIPLRTVPGQADGIAEATNAAGLTVGYLGNQSKTEPEMDQFAVWRSRTTAPQLLGPLRPNVIAEFADVNDHGQAIGTTGTMNPKTGFIYPGRAVIWRTGWPTVRPLAVPPASRRANPFVIPALNDINERGAIVGNVYGLAGKTYSDLRRIDPVVWRCAFGE
jgi:probable HAF family extracellular repeat protein